jgi:hypothetical protein
MIIYRTKIKKKKTIESLETKQNVVDLIELK